jgi:DNA-directed RNA polymerase specialized sigma24 family protein
MEDHELEDQEMSALMVSSSLGSVDVPARKVEPGWEEPALAAALHALQTDPRSPEAARLYRRLETFVKGRVYRTGRSRYGDLLCEGTLEDVIGEVLYQLVSGALLQFRGQSLCELLGFARTVADRALWRAARRRIREREILSELEVEIQGWSVRTPRPDEALIAVPQTPLCTADADYLLSLLHAGSHANLARELGVSRAAVTQRIQRIRTRIGRLTDTEQATAESWLRHSAALHRARGQGSGGQNSRTCRGS